MGRSAADTPTSPDFIRISDAERDRAVDDLKREFVDGRLSHETFMLRMQTALGARNSGQLAGLFGDLPARRSRLARAGAAARKLGRNTRAVVAESVAVIAEPLRGPARYEPDGQLPAPADGDRAPAPAGPPAPLAFPPGDGTSFTIGRHQGCDLYIADMTVSRLHARLTRDNEGWQLTDLGSTNGTRLNGWRVWTSAPIRAGDQVRFGSAEFVLRDDPWEPRPSG